MTVSTPQLFRRSNEVWLPLRQAWGPNGRRGPWGTPPYGQAAAHVVADLAALQTLLLGGTVNSGEVIEVTQDPWDATAYATTPLRGGNAAWANNVLVRPPLGGRVAVTNPGNDFLQVQTKAVTFGGLDCYNLTVKGVADTPTRTGFYRCALNNPDGLGRFSANLLGVDSFFVECISPYSFYSKSSDGSDKDCTQFVAPTRPFMDGCYIAPRHLEVFPSLLSVDTTDLTPRDFTATMSGLASPFIVQYCRVSTPGSVIPGNGNQVTITFKKNGTPFLTLVAPNLTNSNNGAATSAPFSDFSYGKNPGGGGYATFDNGDVLTATLSGVVGTPPRLMIEVGQPSLAHLDSFQNFTIGGTIADQVVQNSVILGSENSAMQIQNVSGLWRLSHNYICRDENYSVNFNPTASGVVCVLDSNQFNGRFSFNDLANTEHHIEGNSFTSIAFGGPTFGISDSNFIDPLMYRIPPDLGDLVAAWPECPFTSVHPYGNKWIF